MAVARLVPLALIAVLAASCGDNDNGSSATPRTTTAATTTAATGPTAATARPAKPSTGKSGLFVGKRNLYPLLAGRLARYVSRPVTANSVQVVQLAGIDSFWAGRGKGQRILVKVDTKGQAPPKVEQGQQVSFVGRLRKAPSQSSGLGVKGETGEPVLRNQGVYVVVNLGDLKLH
jgi:hypothetical protein